MTTAHVTVAWMTSAVHLPIPHPDVHIPRLGGAGRTVEHYVDQVDVPALAVLFSLVGALCYAASSILQQQAAAAQPPETSLRPRLLLRLLRSKRWMLGNLADVGGYAMQFLALRVGALALVMPLFVTGLAFSILGNAFFQRRRPNRKEWLGSAATVAGLGVFVGVAQPGPGHPHASALGWAVLFAVTGTVTAIAIAFARGTPRRRALMLSVATGILYGVTAAITEHTGNVLDGGLLHALTTWAPYALTVVSIAGLLVNQSAYQAGDLRWSLPLLTVLEPIVAILIGQFLFAERIASGAGARTGAGLGLVTMVIGVFWLTGAVSDSPPRPQSPTDGPGGSASDESASAIPVPTATAVDPPLNKPAVSNPAASGSASTAPP